MAATYLPASQHRAQPWKNSLGLSRTIADFPAGAGFDAVLWQVGLTEIGVDCPFSDLPELDRQFIVTAGAGVELSSIDDSGKTRIFLVRPMQPPCAFRGDWKTTCRLLSGPVKVFNVMTRRGRFAAEVSFAGGEALAGEVGGTLVAVELTSLDAWRLEGAGAMPLPAGNSIVVRIREA